MSSNAVGFLLARAGERLVGLPLAQVLQVISIGDVRPVPVTQRSIRGLVTVHGRTMSLVHLESLLHGSSCPPVTGGVGVVIAVDGRQVCLEVEEAEILVREPALPLPNGETLPWAIGVARHGEGLVPLLDLEALSTRLTEAA
ncbi:MAG TPA: chemotaxis protein CheW [Gemmatimonadales bacterium]|nr:chemotaxis protein CheW [Gemmatimonadales bacterium]